MFQRTEIGFQFRFDHACKFLFNYFIETCAGNVGTTIAFNGWHRKTSDTSKNGKFD